MPKSSNLKMVGSGSASEGSGVLQTRGKSKQVHTRCGCETCQISRCWGRQARVGISCTGVQSWVAVREGEIWAVVGKLTTAPTCLSVLCSRGQSKQGKHTTAPACVSSSIVLGLSRRGVVGGGGVGGGNLYSEPVAPASSESKSLKSSGSSKL